MPKYLRVYHFTIMFDPADGYEEDYGSKCTVV